MSKINNTGLENKFKKACTVGAVDDIKELISFGVDVFDKDDKYLLYAFSAKNTRVALFLYKRMTKKMSKEEKSGLASRIAGIATSDRHIDVLEYLLKSGDLIHKNGFPIYSAVKNNQLKLFEFLCKNGFDISDEFRIIHYATYHEDRSIFFKMFELGFDKKMLIQSVISRGDVSAIKEVSQTEVFGDPEKLMQIAATHGQVAMVKYLHQQYGCDINKALPFFNRACMEEIKSYALIVKEASLLRDDIQNTTKPSKGFKV